MPIKVRTPDGGSVKFPDGMTQQQIHDAMRKAFPPPAPQQAAPPAPPTVAGAEQAWAALGQTPPAMDDGPVMPEYAPAQSPMPVPAGQGAGRDAPRGAPKTIGGQAWRDYGAPVLHGSEYTAQEAARGVVQMLGAPVDALNASPMLLNLLPGEQGVGPISDKPIGGSESLWDTVNAPGELIGMIMGYDRQDLQPENAFERISGRVAQELGAAAVPMAIGGRMAQTGARLAPKPAATTRLGRASQAPRNMINRYADGFEANPAAMVRKEAGYAGAAGLGAGVARESVSDGDPTTTTGWETAADLGGSLAGVAALSTGKGVLDAGGELLSGLTGSVVSREGRTQAVEALARHAGLVPNADGIVDTAGLVRAIEDGSDVSAAIPGFKDTLADRTGDTGLASLTYSRQSGPNSGQFRQRGESNAGAVGAKMDAMAPGGDAAAFRQTLDTNVGAALQQIEKSVADAEAAVAQAAQAAAPQMRDAAARGEDVRGALVARRDAELAKVGQMFQQIEQSGVPVDVGPLRDRFDALTKGLTMERQKLVPPQAGTVAQLTPEGAPALHSPREVFDVRSGLSAEGAAAKLAGDQPRAGVTADFIDEVDAYLMEALDPETAAALQAARAARASVGKRFEEPTAVGRAVQETGRGQFRTPPEQVAQSLTPTDAGGITDYRAAMAEVGADPKARAALADQILADAQAANALDSPEALKRFTEQRGVMLGDFPEVQRKLAAAQAELDKTGPTKAKAAADRALLEKGPIGAYRGPAPENAVASIDAAINSSPRPGEAIEALVAAAGGTPQARTDLKNAFWQSLENKARPVRAEARGADGGAQWNFTKLYRTLVAPQTTGDRKMAEAAAALYSDDPQHLDALKEVATLLNKADLHTTMRAPASSGTAQVDQTIRGVSTESLGAYSFAYQRGQIGLPYILVRIASTMGRTMHAGAIEDAYSRILDDALLNPDTAKKLLQDNNPATRALLRQNAKAWVGPAAGELIRSLDADEGSDDGPSAEQRIIDAIFHD